MGLGGRARGRAKRFGDALQTRGRHLAVAAIAAGGAVGIGGAAGEPESSAGGDAITATGEAPLVVTDEPALEATASPETVALARRFQPRLVVARSDRFWPVSVATVLDLELARRRAFRRRAPVATCLRTPRRRCRKQRPTFADLPAGRGQGEYLDYPETHKKAHRVFETVARRLGFPRDLVRTWFVNPGAGPRGTGQFYFHRSRNLPKGKGPRIPPGLENLQYWFFYPLNYLPIAFKARGLLGTDPARATLQTVDYHEGDWEHIDVLVRRTTVAGRVDWKPEYVWMSRHGADEAATFAWNDKSLQRDGEHPVVYAGFGGHANYHRCANHGRPSAAPDDWVVCPDDRPAAPGVPRGPVFVMGDETRLVGLRKDSWACWKGLFGYRNLLRFKHLHAKLGVLDHVRPSANGPDAPLRQFENAGRVCD